MASSCACDEIVQVHDDEEEAFEIPPMASMAHKKASKRPVDIWTAAAAAAAASPEVVDPSANLKQALRRLCISQASEMAAMKRLGKPAVAAAASRVSEAGAIKKLYASVVVRAGDAADDAESRNVVRVSLLPVSIAAEHTEAPKAVSKTQTVNKNSTSTPRARKMRVQDVIRDKSSERSRSPNVVAAPEKKGKSSSKALAGSPRAKPGNVGNLRSAKPLVIRGSSSAKKVKPEPAATRELGTLKSVLQKEPATAVRAKKMPVSPADSAPNNCSGNPTIRTNECRIARSREFGECSQSSKGSVGDYSSSTSISDDGFGSFSGNGNKPHMSKDVRWMAVRRLVSQHGSLTLKNFKLLKKLGFGDIGTVYLGELVGSDYLFAIKVMDMDFLISRRKMLRAQTEREILQMLDHPFLPTLYTHFTSDNLLCLVMEYCPRGDLHVLRQKQPTHSFSEPAARFYVAEVLLALEYLHMLGVIYRDLKPVNILVRGDGHIMLSDFDLSLRCSMSPTSIRLSSVGREEAPRPSGGCSNNSCIDPICIQPTCMKASCFTPRLMYGPPAVPKPQKAGVDAARRPSDRLLQLVVEPTEARSDSFVGTHEYLAPEILLLVYDGCFQLL